MHSNFYILASGDDKIDAINNAKSYMSDIYEKFADYYDSTPTEVISAKNKKFYKTLIKLATQRRNKCRELRRNPVSFDDKYWNTMRRMKVLLGIAGEGSNFADADQDMGTLSADKKQDIKDNPDGYWLVAFDYHLLHKGKTKLSNIIA